MSKKEQRKAKAKAQKRAKEDAVLVATATEKARVDRLMPAPLTAEETIVVERIAAEDEATMALLPIIEKSEEPGRTCPECGMVNIKGRATCSKCRTKLYPSKIAEIKEKKAKAEKQVKAEKQAKTSRYSRLDSVGEAILTLGTFTEEELTSKADGLFLQNHPDGKPNLKESRADAKRGINLLTRLGLVKIEGKEYLYQKPIQKPTIEELTRKGILQVLGEPKVE